MLLPAPVLGLLAFVLGLLIAGCAMLPAPGLARIVSGLALLLSAVAFLGLMQSEGGLVDSCYSYSFLDVSVDQCREIGNQIFGGALDIDSSGPAGQVERGWLALAISKARAENCFALGMGVGALYALLFLRKGTTEVAVVHLMHAVWAASVCTANAQNAGLLPVPAEANIDASSQAKLLPFVVITGVQALLDTCAFLLSRHHDRGPQKAKSS